MDAWKRRELSDFANTRSVVVGHFQCIPLTLNGGLDYLSIVGSEVAEWSVQHGLHCRAHMLEDG